MSEEEINVAIAEACGCTDIENEDFSDLGVPCFIWTGTSPTCGARVAIQDYCGDLNAMHEAEKLLRPPFWKDYSIWQIYIDHFEEDPHATAAQRAEAFLRTLGKWRE